MPRLKASSQIYGDYSGRTGGVRAGLIFAGEIFDATDAQAEHLEARGLAYRYYAPITPRPEALQYQTKVITAEIPSAQSPINAGLRRK